MFYLSCSNQNKETTQSLSTEGSLISGSLFLGNGRSEKPKKGGWCSQKISSHRNLCSLIKLERQWRTEMLPEPRKQGHRQGVRAVQARGGIRNYREDAAIAGCPAWGRAGQGGPPQLLPASLMSVLLPAGPLSVPLTGCCCCGQVNSVVSDSVRPSGQQPPRSLCPQDSPGKNTGVGCHFLQTSWTFVKIQVTREMWKCSFEKEREMDLKAEETWWARFLHKDNHIMYEASLSYPSNSYSLNQETWWYAITW